MREGKKEENNGGIRDRYGVELDRGERSMLDEILYSVGSVEEFRLELIEVMKKRGESLRYLHASLYARVLLEGIEKERECRRVDGMKFVVYPSGSGVDIFVGDDVEDLCEKFGWSWRELRME